VINAGHRLLLVHAHPDDETINNGATMAKYVAQGAHVKLVTCTLGEEGEVLVPELEHLAADQEDRLGQHRAIELAAAMRQLGVTDYEFLGGAGRYRDSGMMGSSANDKLGCFWRADLDEAADQLVSVIRGLCPQVLISYDENDGGYGHPDHIQAHRVAMRAADLAADADHRPDLGPAWRIAKIYWNALPESVMRDGLRRLREAGDTTTFDDLDPDGDLPFVTPDHLVTTRVDGDAFVEAKMAAMRAHATQITVDGPFFAPPSNAGNQIWAVEHYQLVRGPRGPAAGPSGWEADLFGGL
jgi:N-acetyl-1-D-myo-inositol-2-amino-2-deoxy-alpha-D-glucopyranoside deacetylase